MLGLYVGIGGYLRADLDKEIIASSHNRSRETVTVLYKGVEFLNEQQVPELKKREGLGNFFPWIFYLPFIVAIFLTAICFGALGGVFRILKNIALDKSDITNLPVVTLPLVGGMLGLMILGIPYIRPAALTASKNTAQPIAILFLSFIGEVFSEKTVKWLEKQYDKLFKT